MHKHDYFEQSIDIPTFREIPITRILVLSVNLVLFAIKLEQKIICLIFSKFYFLYLLKISIFFDVPVKCQIAANEESLFSKANNRKGIFGLFPKENSQSPLLQL